MYNAQFYLPQLLAATFNPSQYTNPLYDRNKWLRHVMGYGSPYRTFKGGKQVDPMSLSERERIALIPGYNQRPLQGQAPAYGQYQHYTPQELLSYQMTRNTPSSTPYQAPSIKPNYGNPSNFLMQKQLSQTGF